MPDISSPNRFFRFAAIALVCFFSSCLSAAQIDFTDSYERIYQIRVVSPDAGSKSSIGSGFQVSATGQIITNYHVVSQYVNAPENHRIEYVSHDGKTGLLELLDFDVISDLAVLRHPLPASKFFTISESTLEKGEIAYALGNPGDWGVIMVSGPTNGFVEHRYEDRVLFSGSLNRGMSGGPSLNENGEVVGINVATAGSQLSFLIPANKAITLLNDIRQLEIADYQKEIARQLKAWQQPRIQDLIDSEWPLEDFIDKALFGEIRKDFQCWGDTNESDKDREIATVDKSCRAGDNIFLAYGLNVGQITFQLRSTKSIKLNSTQFAQKQKTSVQAVNSSNYENSTNYVCESDFLGTEKLVDGYQRVISCVRAYKKLDGLYDSLLVVQHHQNTSSFLANLSLSALEKAQIKAFHKRFLEALL